MGISFNMYGRLEEAEPLIQQLTTDKDPILRRSGMYTIAMAYCGTGHNQAIRKLLHVAVSILFFQVDSGINKMKFITQFFQSKMFRKADSITQGSY